jgi:hypothetical protein
LSERCAVLLCVLSTSKAPQLDRLSSCLLIRSRSREALNLLTSAFIDAAELQFASHDDVTLPLSRPTAQVAAKETLRRAVRYVTGVAAAADLSALASPILMRLAREEDDPIGRIPLLRAALQIDASVMA